MAAKILTERFALNPAGVTVDREKGVIRNVRICGETSMNGRKYPPTVLRRDFPKYENAKVYFDHSRQGERSVRDVAGWLSDVKPDTDGIPRGNLNLYLTDPNSGKVLEAAERNPNQLGLSHVAECKSEFKGGVEVIESIESVISVDIVTDPATNRGLFESKGNPVAKMKISEVFAKVGPKAGAKKWLKMERFLEMEDGAGDLEMDTPADDTPPDATIADALKVLIGSISDAFAAGEMTADEAGAKVTAFFKAHADEATTADEPAEGDDPPAESKKPGKTAPKAEAFDAAAFKADLLAEIKTLITPKAESDGAEKPKSGGRTAPKQESKQDDKPIPTDPALLKSFLLN